MAAIRASEDFVLLTNGKTAAVLNFRSAAEIQLLVLPKVGNDDARAKPKLKSGNQEQEERSSDDKGENKKEHATEQHNDKDDNQEEHATEQHNNKDSEGRTEIDNQILASALSSDGQLVALCDDRKYLHVFQVQDGRFSLLFSSLVAHRCTSVTLTRNNQQVIVADKSGDAHVFHVQEQVTSHVARAKNASSAGELVEEVQTAASKEKNVDDNPGGCSLLLGHHSMLLDLLVVDDDSLVVTCDRDEKIRVSHYPDAFNIKAYCLGHTKFVVSLAYDESRKVLISGSGDGTVRLWTTGGQELHRRNVLPDVPNESSATETNMAAPLLPEAEAGRKIPQMSIQIICFSSECQTLFVSLYKSPYILVYKLSEAQTDGPLALQFSSALGKGQENVASLCVCRKVLWVLRQEGSRLCVSAYRIQCEDGTVQLLQVTEKDSSESLALKTFHDQAELLTVTTNSLDLMPSLWKPPFQQDVSHKTNPKRLAGDVVKGKQGKRHKRKGDC